MFGHLLLSRERPRASSECRPLAGKCRPALEARPWLCLHGPGEELGQWGQESQWPEPVRSVRVRYSAERDVA